MARKQEGRWTNVSKSVYSLVLSDDVVAAVDRAALVWAPAAPI